MHMGPGQKVSCTLLLVALLVAASSGLRIPGSALGAASAIWTDTTHTTANGSTITKTSGMDEVNDASALTQQALTGDGRIRFTVPSSVNHELAFGLSADASANTLMPFAFSFNGFTAIAEIRENGAYKGEFSWQAGDVLALEVFDGNKVRYLKNGVVVYTSQATATLPLHGDVMIWTMNAGVSNVDIEMESGAAVWTNTIHTTANGSAVTKTSGMDEVNDASAMTQQSLNGNGTIQFTSPASVNHELAFGLSADPSANTSMPFAFAFNGFLPIVEIRENSIYKSEVGWQVGDVFAIEIFDNNKVRYLKNGTVVYTSQATAILPLHGDVMIWTMSAGFTNVSFGGTPPTDLPGDAPQTYDLRSDADVIGSGPPVAPTPPQTAGGSYFNPTFGTTTIRVTDDASYADHRSWGTPSAPNLNMIASNDRKFYTISDDGSLVLFYDFDPATGEFWFDHERSFLTEPTFSRKTEKPNIVYTPHYGYTVFAYNVETETLAPTPLITLTDEVGPMSQEETPEWPNGQYIGAVYSSQGTPERIAVTYGAVQNLHPYMTVFEADNPANRITLNLRASQYRVNGEAWQTLLNADGTEAHLDWGVFGTHSMALDRSGTWVKLDLPGDLNGPFHSAFFNVETRRIHEWTSPAWGGHYSLGWEAHVSAIAEPNSGGTGMMQWLFTDLRQGGLPPAWRALITNPAPPDNDERAADHSNWNNARSDLLVPIISGTQRAPDSSEWWRYYDEIVAVATDPTAPAQVYRAGYHYNTAVDANGNLLPDSFRDSARVQVTHNGMWTFFTSNWGLKLGTVGGVGPNFRRRDLFVLKMDRD